MSLGEVLRLDLRRASRHRRTSAASSCTYLVIRASEPPINIVFSAVGVALVRSADVIPSLANDTSV